MNPYHLPDATLFFFLFSSFFFSALFSFLSSFFFFSRDFCTYKEYCQLQTFEDTVLVAKLSVKEFGSYDPGVYRKKEKALITLLTESMPFCQFKGKCFCLDTSFFSRSFKFYTNAFAYQVMQDIDKKVQ